MFLNIFDKKSWLRNLVIKELIFWSYKEINAIFVLILDHLVLDVCVKWAYWLSSWNLQCKKSWNRHRPNYFLGLARTSITQTTYVHTTLEARMIMVHITLTECISHGLCLRTKSYSITTNTFWIRRIIMSVHDGIRHQNK